MPTRINANQLDTTVVTMVNLDQRYLTFTKSDGQEIKIDLNKASVVSQILPAFNSRNSTFNLKIDNGKAGATFTIQEKTGTGLSGITLPVKQLDASGSYDAIFDVNSGFSLGLHEWLLNFSDLTSSLVQFIVYNGISVPLPPSSIDDEVRIINAAGNNLYNEITRKWYIQFDERTTIQFRKLAAYGVINIVEVTKVSGQKTLYEAIHTIAPGMQQTTPTTVDLPADVSFSGDYVYHVKYKDSSNVIKREFDIAITVSSPSVDLWDSLSLNINQNGTVTKYHITEGVTNNVTVVAATPFTAQFEKGFGLDKIVVEHNGGIGDSLHLALESTYNIQTINGSNTGLSEGITRTIANDVSSIGTYLYVVKAYGGSLKRTSNITFKVSDPNAFIPEAGPWDNAKFVVTRSNGDLLIPDIRSYFTNGLDGINSSIGPKLYVGESVKGQWTNIQNIEKVIISRTNGPNVIVWEGVDSITNTTGQVHNPTINQTGSFEYKIEFFKTGGVKVREFTWVTSVAQPPKVTSRLRIINSGNTNDIALDGQSVNYGENTNGTYQFINMGDTTKITITALSTLPGIALQQGTFNINTDSPLLNLIPFAFDSGNYKVNYKINIVYDDGKCTSDTVFSINYAK